MSSRAASVARFGSRFVLDAIAWAIAIWLALWFRYEFAVPAAALAPAAILILVTLFGQLVFGFVFELYRGRFSFGSIEEVEALTFAVASTAVILGVPVLLFGSGSGIPRSIFLIATPLALLLMFSIRFIKRLLVDQRMKPKVAAVPTLVYGAGALGSALVRQMVSDPASRYRPVGLLDDDPAKRNIQVRDVRVLGTFDALPRIVARTRARLLVVAVPRADSALLRRVQDAAIELDLAVKIVPPLSDILSGSLGTTPLRDMSIEDLVGRRPVDTDVASIAGYLTGRRVLVTGAGGSIGCELCTQIAAFAPAELVMLDRDETGLQHSQLGTSGHGLLDTDEVVLCDIRDPAALAEVFAQRKPEVVFHAAALKHLPMLEQYPDEAWKTNVLGTLNVLHAARAAGVGTFINISTDKAANPTSVLGRSKRVAERLTAWAAQDTGERYLSVRFGNVMGSRGSMLPTFEALIAAGKPLTVTHPDATRYFMTIPEACQLVIQAGAIGRPGEVLILDMGEPVHILEVAKRMIAMSGTHVDIVFTGLRDGEKLHEELIGSHEDVDRPFHPMISHTRADPLHPATLDRSAWMPHATAARRTGDGAAVRPEGPAPVNARVYLSPPDIGPREEEAVVRALRSGWVAPLGPEVDAFEHELAQRVGVAHAVALSSGTAALHLGLLALGTGPGDVVVTSTMTFVATANAITYTGAEPYFVDADPRTGNMSPELLRDALTALRRAGEPIAAVVPVDLLGKAVDYTAILAIADEFDVPVLADAAESLGATHRGRAAGSFGRASVVSFNGNKIMTTSGGGMLLTDDERIASRARYLATQARQPVVHYEHTDVGYNYRLSNLLAALGRAQLSRLDDMIARRRDVRSSYKEVFARVPGVEVFGGEDDAEDSAWLTSIVVDPDVAGWSAADLTAHLAQDDIESRPLWKPMHLQPLFAGARGHLTGAAEGLFTRGVTLPSGSALTSGQRARVLERITSFLGAGVRT